MIKKFTDIIKINEATRQFGCLMAELGFTDKVWVIDVLKLIDENDLYIVGDEYGLEFEPHVTVLYGLHDDEINDGDIERDVKSLPILTNCSIDLQKISIFENNDFDVVKFDIHSKELKNANNFFKNTYPNTSNYPDYHAHCTIAYVKKGTGQKYVQTLQDSIAAVITNYIYSKPNGSKIRIIK